LMNEEDFEGTLVLEQLATIGDRALSDYWG
jgi:hypothetical protein